MNLQRYWIRFQLDPFQPGPRPGCGVTAHNYEDALAILRNTVFCGKELPSIEHVIEGVDISSLDQKHVIPNMEVPVWRGVWYPKGYSQIR
jgi:hypothetical protein